MFEVNVQSIEPNRGMRYSLTLDGQSLTFADVLELWEQDQNFRRSFNQLLAESAFDGFRWETPGLSTTTVLQPFQFVLLNSPGLCARETDSTTFDDHFTTNDTNDGVVVFHNLGRDATLVVPSPRAHVGAYGHLAAFVRQAPESQQHALWKTVGRTVRSMIGQSPLWLSTAGGGVAWLHVRIDSIPKYYGYSPFRGE